MKSSAHDVMERQGKSTSVETVELMCEIIEKQNKIIRDQEIIIGELGGLALEEEICEAYYLIHDELGL